MLAVVTSIQVYLGAVSLGSIITFFTNTFSTRFHKILLSVYAGFKL